MLKDPTLKPVAQKYGIYKKRGEAKQKFQYSVPDAQDFLGFLLN